MCLLTNHVFGEWVNIEQSSSSTQWNLPPQSAGQHKYVWQRYLVKKNGDTFRIVQLTKYDCYLLKYYLVEAKSKKNNEDPIALPNPATWYSIIPNSDDHKTLVKYGVCPDRDVGK